MWAAEVKTTSSGVDGKMQTHMCAQEELQAEEKKRKKPPTSNKQMKKWGIPLRKEKKGEMETKTTPENENTGQREEKSSQKLTKREEKKRREERRVAREVRRKKTKENKLKKEKKAKAAREELEKEGLRRNKNQQILRDWLRGGSMKLPKQGESRGAKKQGQPKKGIG